MPTSSQPSSILALPHFTVCFLSPLQGRKYLLSISTLSHYLCVLCVLKFHFDRKEPGVVTSDQKCYLTFCFTKHNNINSKGSKQRQLKFYDLVEMCVPCAQTETRMYPPNNGGKVSPCTKAGFLLPLSSIIAILSR